MDEYLILSLKRKINLTHFFNNICTMVSVSKAFLYYMNLCLKNKTKGQIKIDIYNGEIKNIKGMFQKDRGVNIYNHVSIH